LFYDQDGELMPPLPELIVVAGSSIDKAYSDAGIVHAVIPAKDLLAKGYVNPFLIKLVPPQERAEIAERCKRTAEARANDPRPAPPGQPGPLLRHEPSAPSRSGQAPSAPPGRASARYDAEGLGRGTVPSGGYKVRR